MKENCMNCRYQTLCECHHSLSDKFQDKVTEQDVCIYFVYEDKKV